MILMPTWRQVRIFGMRDLMVSNSQQCVQSEGVCCVKCGPMFRCGLRRRILWFLAHTAERAVWCSGKAPVGKYNLKTRVFWLNFLRFFELDAADFLVPSSCLLIIVDHQLFLFVATQSLCSWNRVVTYPKNQFCVELTALVKAKMKVKFTLEEATKAQRGSRCIALYFFINLGARWGWVVNAMARPLYPGERPGTPCTGVWVGPRACLDGCGKYRLHRDSISVPPSP